MDGWMEPQHHKAQHNHMHMLWELLHMLQTKIHLLSSMFQNVMWKKSWLTRRLSDIIRKSGDIGPWCLLVPLVWGEMNWKNIWILRIIIISSHLCHVSKIRIVFKLFDRFRKFLWHALTLYLLKLFLVNKSVFTSIFLKRQVINSLSPESCGSNL